MQMRVRCGRCLMAEPSRLRRRVPGTDDYRDLRRNVRAVELDAGITVPVAHAS